MDALLRKLAVSLIRDAAPKAADRRRPSARPAPACDVLEGRQLLAGGLMSGGLGGAHARGHGFVPVGEVRGLTWGHRASADWATPASANPPEPSTTPGSPTDSASTTATTATPSTAPTSTTPTPLGPDLGDHKALTAQAKADLQTLRTDTQAIQAGSGATTGQYASLRQDLDSLRKDATTAPSQAALTAFQADLSSLRGTLPTAAQAAQLEADDSAVLTSEGVTDSALIQKSIADQAAIASSSNVTQAQLDKITADRKAVAADLGITAPPTSADPPPGRGGMAAGADLLGGLTGGALDGPGGGFGGPGGRARS